MEYIKEYGIFDFLKKKYRGKKAKKNIPDMFVDFNKSVISVNQSSKRYIIIKTYGSKSYQEAISKSEEINLKYFLMEKLLLTRCCQITKNQQN